MTTTVVISSPKPNHHNIMVQTTINGVPKEEGLTILTDGESTVKYVYGTVGLLITEIPKDVIDAVHSV